MKHYYPNVPGLGNVALSRHAQARAKEEKFSEAMVEQALLSPLGSDIPDGHDVVFRDRGPLRFVINKRPHPFRGACLATTIIRIKPQARAK
jgi:hypothetical protein